MSTILFALGAVGGFIFFEVVLGPITPVNSDLRAAVVGASVAIGGILAQRVYLLWARRHPGEPRRAG